MIKICIGLLTFVVAAIAACTPASAQLPQKPNILFIMGDDIGIMQPSIYHRGLMVGETPNIDRIGQEGALFMTYYAEQSCTAGRTAFFTGMHPIRAGMVMPQLPGATSSLLPGTPSLAKVLLDLGYNTGEFGKNHLGDKAASLPTAHGVQEFWGYLYHLDAMQGVSFPDINKSPTAQTVVPPWRHACSRTLRSAGRGRSEDRFVHDAAKADHIVHVLQRDRAKPDVQGRSPLTLERSKTVDEEISAKVVDYLDRNDPKKTNKPFFVWYNPARMHITTVFSPKYEAMLGEKGEKDWGINEVGMKQLDDNIGVVLKKLQDMGQLDNTIVVFTTDNGAEAITYPDGGVTPFRGGKLTTWEGGMRAPLVVRWPGHIKPGTVNTEIISGLDWLPTLADIAGGPKGDGLKKTDRGPTVPRLRQDNARRCGSAGLSRRSGPSARDTLYYWTGTHPSAVRYKNWKFYYTMAPSSATGGLTGTVTYHWTQVDNIKRDPFEQAVAEDQKTLLGMGGAIAAPSTAYIYDWNLVPIGQLLWLKELETFRTFPALQSPASYNLDQIIQAMQEARTISHAGD